MESNKIYLNDAQLEINMVQAQTTLAILGRGGGKTHGLIGPKLLRDVRDMPRGNHFLASSSYEKVLNDILPKVQKFWDEAGFKEGIHYWVRQWAPEKLRIPKPYLPPTMPHYIVHWANGACVRLVSVDRPKLFVGTDGDTLAADEVRLFNPEIFTQLLLNIRGNSDKFGHLSNHHSVLMTTDLPRDRKGDWLFEFENEMDNEKVELILQAQQFIYECRVKLATAKTKKAKRELIGKIDQFHQLSEDLRRGLVYVKYASSLENIAVLGIETIEKWKKTMSAEAFGTSVLTIRQKMYGQYFYSMFNQEDHTYTATDFEVLDQLNLKDYHSAPWSTIQTDIRRDQPLHLSGDFNAAIIWLVIGQRLAGRINGVGSLWLTKPKKVRHLAKLFDQHFGAKKRYNNQIIFHFDQTAKPENAINDDTYISEWITRLKELGWSVRENYIGAAPTHEARYALYEKLFDHRDISTPNLHLNKNTNSDLIKGMEDAPVQHSMSGGKRRFKKDKRSENSKVIPPQHATHGTEALDILVWGMAVESTSFEFINTLTGL